MKNRKPVRLIFPLFMITIAVVIIFFLLPQGAYTRQATALFNNAHAICIQKETETYTIVVVSNSRMQPIGGRNILKVKGGKVVAVYNPNCPGCSVELFTSITVESFFNRIQNEYLTDFPLQFCGISYDKNFGYPMRIDTYPNIRDGQERPSITVENLFLDDAQ